VLDQDSMKISNTVKMFTSTKLIIFAVQFWNSMLLASFGAAQFVASRKQEPDHGNSSFNNSWQQFLDISQIKVVLDEHPCYSVSSAPQLPQHSYIWREICGSSLLVGSFKASQPLSYIRWALLY
jgi:hypothetical protein